MGRIGLEGRSFVSLLSSYACAVPGIMATRTIPSPRDRLVTILVAPLMTCSARLPVYALLIGAFVPAVRCFGPFGLQGLVLLGLYLLGALAALLRRGGAEAHAAARRGAALLHGAAALPHADAAALARRRSGAARAPSCAAPARSSSRVSIVLWVLLQRAARRARPPGVDAGARRARYRARAQPRRHARATRSSR